MVDFIHPEQTGKKGEAYALFNCPVSRKQLEKALPDIRERARIPNELELTLKETKELDREANPQLAAFIEDTGVCSTYPSKDRGLMATAQPTRLGELTYALCARHPNQSTQRTARELGHVVDQAHLNYQSGRIFTGAIVGKGTNRKYGVWDDRN